MSFEFPILCCFHPNVPSHTKKLVRNQVSDPDVILFVEFPDIIKISSVKATQEQKKLEKNIEELELF